ncbi:DNA polymerase/3'-5' exonuclease PolX [Rhizosphaericola mali]|uniref:DNA polymerase/3'-5' exonuclease PolX n=1 Tax=Rhizosphaericola mali TaxID=2545455 RepID=A0A5P2G6Z4_9BACT|nr:DNA polymerase/3'-5' exonuclease PolX [Rhizosphaericola mali]QES90039.1 DNA polymerase/3'-5' exonuclease PolX [Rhizosphaericola mali]
MINNEIIAGNFALLAKLMEVNGENPFKIKSYANVVRTIEKYPQELSELLEAELFQIKGIGDAIGNKIIEQLHTGKLTLLEKYLQETPAGIIEMLQIKGLGVKKIVTIWKELGIETLGELLYACEENRLMHYKGFGEKTQENIKAIIEFYLKSQGLLLYAEAEAFYNLIQKTLDKYKNFQFLIAGAYREQQEIIEKLVWVTDADKVTLESIAEKLNWTIIDPSEKTIEFITAEKLKLVFHFSTKESIVVDQFLQTGSDEFHAIFPLNKETTITQEEDIFTNAGLHYIPAYRRDYPEIIETAKQKEIEIGIQVDQIKGIIHCHSVWSDGANTIEEMALAAANLNMEYIAMSDHSQSAFYANGLTPERILEQHKEIEDLNTKNNTIPIFKSIESDILYDGNLDYAPEILSQFDIIIASVHSILKMDKEKATSRIIAAVENPFTSILGHMTGRLLLSRAGYPIDHSSVIDACAAHNVVIELNAHPRRLDIDWKWIDYALNKGVKISINSDAHSTEGLKVLKYGVLVAQKTGLSTTQNISSYSLDAFQEFLQQQKTKRP